MLPARVTLSLYFFQETRDKKKLVASLLKLHSYHDPRPEGVYTKDGKTLIEPRDLSPPACCIIQRHPTKCSEIYIDDNGKEKTMQIPLCANVSDSEQKMNLNLTWSRRWRPRESSRAPRHRRDACLASRQVS